MSDQPQTEALDNPDGNGVVVLTRKRWDRYFVVATAAAVALGLVFSVVLEERSPLTWPLSIAGFWILWRFQTPASGIPARRISAIPVARPLLVWLAFMGLLFAGTLAFDRVVLGQRLHEPLKLYHLGLYAPLIVVLLVGVWLIEKRYPNVRDQRPAEAEKA